MINLKHKYALLANGKIEKLWYSPTEERMAHEMGGVFYLTHDVPFYKDGRWVGYALVDDEIVATSNDRKELEHERDR